MCRTILIICFSTMDSDLLMAKCFVPLLAASSQATGTTVISKPVAPSTIIHQGCPAPTPLPVTTTLHRPPVLQVAEPRKALPTSVQRFL